MDRNIDRQLDRNIDRQIAKIGKQTINIARRTDSQKDRQIQLDRQIEGQIGLVGLIDSWTYIW